tara:strand:- start:1744 stop:2097 length:354 start_codon:yes stop_codon:yes gene_type:complete
MINYTFYLGEFNGYSYVGSTNSYQKRQRDHYYNCYNENAPKHNYNCYQKIRNAIEKPTCLEDFRTYYTIIAEISFPDEDEEILRRHVEEMENTFIRMFNTTLNKIMPLGNSFNKYEE